MAYTKLTYHIVFSTKERRPFLQGESLGRVCQYLGGILREQKAHPQRIGGMEDHIHIAVSLSPTVAVSDIIRVVKTNCSRWIHETLEDLAEFAWQQSYAAFTVSESVLPDVVRYIEGQAAHHKRQTFQEELLALLARHGIEYDERYIWS